MTPSPTRGPSRAPRPVRQRARRVRDRALLLRRFPYGESSLVVHALTREHGRVALLAKGAYRPTSGYFAVLDLFDSLELTWSPRAEGLGLLLEAGILVRRRSLSTSLPAFHAALGVLELTGLALQEHQGDPRLHELAESFLDALAARGAAPGLLAVAHDLKFLRDVGLAPALTACAACGARAPRTPPTPSTAETAARVDFAPGAGGRLCPPCAAEARSSGRRILALPLNVLGAADSLMASPVEALGRLRMAPELLAAVRSFVQGFLETHLETRPKRRPPRS